MCSLLELWNVMCIINSFPPWEKGQPFVSLNQNFAKTYWSSTNLGSKYITTDLVENLAVSFKPLFIPMYVSFYSIVLTCCGCSLTPRRSWSFTFCFSRDWILNPLHKPLSYRFMCVWGIKFLLELQKLTVLKERSMGENES